MKKFSAIDILFDLVWAIGMLMILFPWGKEISDILMKKEKTFFDGIYLLFFSFGCITAFITCCRLAFMSCVNLYINHNKE